MSAILWQLEQHVECWRLEFEFRRDSIKQLAPSSSYEDLKLNLAGLWNYATQAWLRLAIPNPNDKTQSRWPTAPLWKILQNVEWKGKSEYKRIPVEKGRPPSDRTLFVNGLSGFD